MDKASVQPGPGTQSLQPALDGSKSGLQLFQIGHQQDPLKDKSHSSLPVSPPPSGPWRLWLLHPRRGATLSATGQSLCIGQA